MTKKKKRKKIKKKTLAKKNKKRVQKKKIKKRKKTKSRIRQNSIKLKYNKKRNLFLIKFIKLQEDFLYLFPFDKSLHLNFYFLNLYHLFQLKAQKSFPRFLFLNPVNLS